MSLFCSLGDCEKQYCHHCYPVINCSLNHEYCKENGICNEIILNNKDIKKILVTGCCGFIGSHVSEYLLKLGYNVYGIDIINDYYDVNIKQDNLNILKEYSNFTFSKDDICSTDKIGIFKPDKICHLASMAGVRYSIENPQKYIDVNIKGFIHILEECIKHNVKNIVYASSSSVYGLNKKTPFSESDNIELCNSPYAVSKLAMEQFAKTYSNLYNISCIGLRFFTVYGPRGRPDMAPYKFIKAISSGEKFYKYGNGETSRDYTYITDIVDGIYNSLINKNNIKSKVYNLGNSKPVSLNNFIKLCEKIIGKEAVYETLSDQLGDVPYTYADISLAKKDLDYNPKVQLEEGLTKFYSSYSKLQ